MHAYIRTIKKYAVFSGRTSRKEYWSFVYIDLIIGLVIMFIGMAIDLAMGTFNVVGPAMISLFFVYFLFRLIPYIAATVRRLHDTGRSGWWTAPFVISMLGHLHLKYFSSIPASITQIVGIVSTVLTIIVFILALFKGMPGANKYGENPDLMSRD